MPLKHGKENIGPNITELEEHGSRPRSHKQILAIALHEALDRKALGGEIERLSVGGTGGMGGQGGGLGDQSSMGTSPFAGTTVDAPQSPQSNLNLSGLPGAQGIPLGLQLAAIQAMTAADKSIRQGQGQQQGQQQQQPMLPINSVAGLGAYARGGMPSMGSAPKAPKGGVFGVLNQKPPRGLARLTEPVVRGGMLHSTVPGRTDALATKVRSGSHIIPADVVSSLGQGNSMAGASHLDMLMRDLPSPAFASGGSTNSGHPHHRLAGEDHQPVLLAGGEYVVEPEHVRALGGGDPKKGHDALDHMIVNVRKDAIAKLKKLPGPKK